MTTSSHLPITNGRLGYRCVGTGPDLVFVHGWPLHREIWSDVAAALPDFRCHLIDLPGAGESIHTGGSLGFTELVRGLGEAIDHLGLERFAVIANDSGGMVARRLVATRTDQVSALVLTGTEIPDQRPWLIRFFLALGKIPFASPVLRLSLSNRLLRRSPFVLGAAFDDRSLIEGDFTATFLEPLVRDRELLRRQLEVLASYRWADVDSLRDAHAQIIAPVLLLWGARDPVFPATRAQAMSSQFAGSVEFDTIERGRLFAFAEFPEEFAARVRSFLASSGRPDQHHRSGAAPVIDEDSAAH